MDMTTRYRDLAKLAMDAMMGDRPVKIFEVLIINTPVLSSICVAVQYMYLLLPYSTCFHICSSWNICIHSSARLALAKPACIF